MAHASVTINYRRNTSINVDLVEQIARLYVTHPGVTVDGILEKMGVK